MSEQNVKSENRQSQSSAGEGQKTQPQSNEPKEAKENKDGKNSRNTYHSGAYRGNGGYRQKGHYDKDHRDNQRPAKNAAAEAGQKQGVTSQTAETHRERRYGGAQGTADTAPYRNSRGTQSAGSPENNGTDNVQNTQQNNNASRYNNRSSRGYQRDHNRSRAAQNIKVEETKEDIIRDIGRIEKEIELEIKEISALKFGI